MRVDGATASQGADAADWAYQELVVKRDVPYEVTVELYNNYFEDTYCSKVVHNAWYEAGGVNLHELLDGNIYEPKDIYYDSELTAIRDYIDGWQ